MFPRGHEGTYEVQGSRCARPRTPSPPMPRHNSHPSGFNRVSDFENREGDDVDEFPSRARTNPVHRQLHFQENRSMLGEEDRLPHPMLPSMSTLMQLNTHFHDGQHHIGIANLSRLERQHPEFVRGRPRAQTIPQIHTNVNPAASTTVITPPRATRSTSIQVYRQEMASELPLGPSAFAIPRFIEERSRRSSVSPINRSNRWTPYDPMSTSTSRTAPRESVHPLAASWDGDDIFRASETFRRGRASPRQRLAASKARAILLPATTTGTGVLGVAASDQPKSRFHDRNHNAPLTSFAFSPPKLSTRFSPSSSAASSQTPTHVDDGETSSSKKTSRYLREIDRRTILARIDQGEKQSALAREFQVTRAAICNLNKHRDIVLARRHEDPLAKHPKKSKLDSGSDFDYEDVAGESLELRPKVQAVATQPAERLIPLLLSSKTSHADFRRYCDRLMTLVIEETLAWTHTEVRNSIRDDSVKPPIPCGVAIAPGGTPMLSVFQCLEPELPSGHIELRGLPPVAVVLELPTAVASHNLCLFYTFTDDVGEVCVKKSIRELLNRGAVEELLCLVTLGVSTKTAENLQRAHPHLRIATAHIENGEDIEYWMDRNSSKNASTKAPSRLQLLARRVAEFY